MDLSLSIPQVRGGCSLTDCLEEFIEPEKMEQCGFKCEKCKAVDRMDKDMTVFRFPKILVMHLKRFAGSNSRNRVKLTTSIDIPKKINMRPYAPYSGKYYFNQIYLYSISLMYRT